MGAKKQPKTKYIPVLRTTRYALHDQKGFTLPRNVVVSNGFTLIELLIATGIGLTIAFFIFKFSGDLTDYSLRFNRSLVSQQEVLQTLQLMLPEIRSASPSNTGAYPIIVASTSTFTFFSDVYRDGKFDQVRYFLNGTTFQKGVIKPIGNPLTYPTSSEIIIDQVHGLIATSTIFTYYDSSATSTDTTPLPQPVDVLKVKMVKVSLLVDEGTTSTASLAGVNNQATIRNLRYK